MVISIPKILTTESSGNYIMSIRLRPDGLSFTGYDPEDEETFFTRTIEQDSSMSYLSFVEEVFFANEWLTFPFKQVNIVFTSAPFLLVPEAVYDETRKEELFSFVYTSPADVCLANSLEEENSVLLFGVEKELYEFCSRTVVQPHFYHRATPLLSVWKKQSRLEFAAQMYVILNKKKMEVFCYSQGKLRFVNTFDAETDHERLYFAMSVWKELNLNQLTDQLNVLSDDTEDVLRMKESFKVYIRNVKQLDGMSELKFREVDPANHPLDLIVLAL